MIVKYVEYLYPGLLFPEPSIRRLNEGEQPEPPKGCVGFRTFERREVEADGDTLKGEARDYSGWTYFGEELSLERVRAEQPGSILLFNMEGNNWSRVVRLYTGQAYALTENDTVRDAAQEMPV